MTGGNTVTNYAYPTGANQPHTLTGTTTTGPGAGTTSYTYDQTGNTLTCGVASGNQALTWDQENRLAKVASAAGETSFVYDADGRSGMISRILTRASTNCPEPRTSSTAPLEAV